MRFSEYFVQVALLAEKGDVVEAERLLREAERYYQKSVKLVRVDGGLMQLLHKSDTATADEGQQAEDKPL